MVFLDSEAVTGENNQKTQVKLYGEKYEMQSLLSGESGAAFSGTV